MESGSYLLLEPGMTVRDRLGNDLGEIAEVVSDEQSDIFRGIVLTVNRLSQEEVFVSGEYVARVDGAIAIVDFELSHLSAPTDRSGGLRALL